MFKRPKTLVCYICGREYGSASLGIHVKSCQQKWEQQQMLLPKNQRRPIPTPPPGLAQLMGSNKVTMKDAHNFNEQAYDTYNQEALVKCPFCNRTFVSIQASYIYSQNQDRIDIHRRICTRDKPFKPLPGAERETNQPKQMYDQYPKSNQASSNQKSNLQAGKQKYNQNEYDDDFESYPIYQKGQLKQKKQDYQEEQYQMPSKSQPQKGILKKGKQNFNDPEEYNYSGGGAMLMPCKYCGRNFNPDRIDRHQNACRTANKPRKAKYFGAFGKKVGGGPPKKQKPMKKPPSKWRKEHEDFISGLRAARQYSSKNSMQTQLQGRFMGGSQQSKYSGGGPSKYQSQQPKPYSSQKKQPQKYNDDDDYDPFAYKQKVTSTQKQVQRKQFNPDTHQAPSTVKTTKKANTTAKKPYQYNQLNDDIQMGGGGGSYLEKLEQQYKRNTPAKPIQNVGGASKYGNSGPGGGGRGGGVLDPTSNAHSRNLIFADSGYGSTYQPSYQDQWATTYTNAYADSKPKQNAFSVPGQQKTYIDTPYQTQLNQGGAAQQYNQRQQPYGHKYDF